MFLLILAVVLLSGSSSSSAGAAPHSAPEQEPPKPPDVGTVLIGLVGAGVDAYRQYLAEHSSSAEH